MRRRARLTGMQAAGLLAAARLRDVDAARGELPLELGLLERRLTLGHRRRQLVAHGVDARAGLAALVGRERAQRLEQRGDRALLAEQLDLERLELREAAQAAMRARASSASWSRSGGVGCRSSTLS